MQSFPSLGSTSAIDATPTNVVRRCVRIVGPKAGNRPPLSQPSVPVRPVRQRTGDGVDRSLGRALAWRSAWHGIGERTRRGKGGGSVEDGRVAILLRRAFEVEGVGSAVGWESERSETAHRSMSIRRIVRIAADSMHTHGWPCPARTFLRMKASLHPIMDALAPSRVMVSGITCTQWFPVLRAHGSKDPIT